VKVFCNEGVNPYVQVGLSKCESYSKKYALAGPSGSSCVWLHCPPDRKSHAFGLRAERTDEITNIHLPHTKTALHRLSPSTAIVLPRRIRKLFTENAIYINPSLWVGKSRDSSVGIALGYGLDSRGSRARFPARAGNFSLHHRVQIGSGVHPAFYPMGTRGSFPGGKAAGA
jgi:hypothetical protein